MQKLLRKGGVWLDRASSGHEEQTTNEELSPDCEKQPCAPAGSSHLGLSLLHPYGVNQGGMSRSRMRVTSWSWASLGGLEGPGIAGEGSGSS